MNAVPTSVLAETVPLGRRRQELGPCRRQLGRSDWSEPSDCEYSSDYWSVYRCPKGPWATNGLSVTLPLRARSGTSSSWTR